MNFDLIDYSNCASCQCNNNNNNFQFTFDLKHNVNLINHFSIINYYNYYNDPKNNLDNSTSDTDENSNTDFDTDSSLNAKTESSSETELTNDLDEYKYNSENDIMYNDEESKEVDKLIEKIVRCYTTCVNYEEEIENIKLIGLENGMYYNNINEEHLYNNSLFIIT